MPSQRAALLPPGGCEWRRSSIVHAQLLLGLVLTVDGMPAVAVALGLYAQLCLTLGSLALGQQLQRCEGFSNQHTPTHVCVLITRVARVAWMTAATCWSSRIRLLAEAVALSLGGGPVAKHMLHVQ